MSRTEFGFNSKENERQERKAFFIARATAQIDTPEIREEASDKFDEVNPVESK